MSLSFVRKEALELMFQCRNECFSWIKESWGILINSEIKNLDFANMVSDLFSWEELRLFFFLNRFLEIWKYGVKDEDWQLITQAAV